MDGASHLLPFVLEEIKAYKICPKSQNFLIENGCIYVLKSCSCTK